MKKDLDLLVSQANRCREILKKLSINQKLMMDLIQSRTL